MIKIDKPEDVPIILTRNGKRERQKLCYSYTRMLNRYGTPPIALIFKDNIANHSTVKQKLIDIQYGKCCYCECIVNNEGDVEHFRPKKAYSQGADNALIRPGYYWLAYDWENLLLSCKACNNLYKRNCFPLENPDDRAISHKYNLQNEKPLLINPAKEHPEQFIGFRSEIAYSINDDIRGKTTREILNLNRENLVNSRRTRFKELKALWIILKDESKFSNTEDGRWVLEHAKTTLQEAVKPQSLFTSMARTAIANNFQPQD